MTHWYGPMPRDNSAYPSVQRTQYSIPYLTFNVIPVNILTSTISRFDSWVNTTTGRQTVTAYTGVLTSCCQPNAAQQQTHFYSYEPLCGHFLPTASRVWPTAHQLAKMFFTRFNSGRLLLRGWAACKIMSFSTWCFIWALVFFNLSQADVGNQVQLSTNQVTVPFRRDNKSRWLLLSGVYGRGSQTIHMV